MSPRVARGVLEVVGGDGSGGNTVGNVWAVGLQATREDGNAVITADSKKMYGQVRMTLAASHGFAVRG